MRDIVTTGLEVAGFGCLVVAGFLVATVVGVVALGAALIVLGWLLGRRG